MVHLFRLFALYCVVALAAPALASGGIGGGIGAAPQGGSAPSAPATPVPGSSGGSTSAPPASAFDVLYGQDLPGGDFRSPVDEPGLKNISLDQCEAACREDTRCLAYTYNANSEWCFLKDVVLPAAPFSGAISGIRRAHVPVQPQSDGGITPGGSLGGAVSEARIELAADNPGPTEGTLGGVTVRLSYRDAVDDFGAPLRAPTLEVFANGVQVARVEAESNGWDWPPAIAQVAEMDPTNATPEVYFSVFTGGAHCCGRVRLVTARPGGGPWQVVEVGDFDGDPIGTEDIDGDGIYEWVTWDNAFLYAFSSYAESFAPTTIYLLRGGQMIDATFEPRFRFVHEQWLTDTQGIQASLYSSGSNPNGYLAAYVAVRAILGETADAWSFMLEQYNRTVDWDYTHCSGGYDASGYCIGEVRYQGFPEALQAFLTRTGYMR